MARPFCKALQRCWFYFDGGRLIVCVYGFFNYVNVIIIVIVIIVCCNFIKDQIFHNLLCFNNPAKEKEKKKEKINKGNKLQNYPKIFYKRE